MPFYISVSGPVIHENKTQGCNKPPIRIFRHEHDDDPIWCYHVLIIGDSRISYTREPRLRCNSNVVFEVEDFKVIE